MAGIGCTRLEIAKIAVNGRKWLKIMEWLEMAGNVWKWLEMAVLALNECKC